MTAGFIVETPCGAGAGEGGHGVSSTSYRMNFVKLADSFYDGGLEFAAVGAAKVEFVAGEPNGNGIAAIPFAGSVAIGRGTFALPSREDNHG